MKRFSIKKVISMILIFSIFSTQSSFATELDDAMEQKENLEKELNNSEEKLENLKESESQINGELENLDTQLTEVSGKLENLEGELKLKQEDIQRTSDELEYTKKQLKSEYEMMKKRIKFTYENNSMSILTVLLESDSIAGFLNKITYFLKISDYEQRKMDEYNKLANEVSQKKEKLQKEYDEASALKNEITARQEELTSLVAEKQKAKEAAAESIAKAEEEESHVQEELDATNETITAIKQALAAMEAERKAAEEAARQKAQEEAKKQAENAANNDVSNDNNSSPEENTNNGSGGVFLWPCPSSTRISSDYGYREIIDGVTSSTSHNGIDIPAAAGSNIIAAESGKVIIARYSNTAGNWITISHGNGLCSVYMHASKLYVSEGQNVNKGDVIAAVGTTGSSTGNHLHFGVSLNGAYVNPWNYLR
ncbi:Murein DD-endopeptidase MepM and murein hydrolase activator NlpD, contain LysM domain [Acetitomaculum ruminis DSM 5522]|uniref:Murein DD-endopeptidase MepM and murein hydrolase activator NlpD, contain LysM domain n=1 Tax=Acetitomaculum ruminis DSM 5522 TaxID=1120918 RepID=A0A1I0XBB8_9FIRM|nr:peptidoglycan DD-metalloendopeptidase family protein [Acetitomaculum ruminis]SFA98379.1 Murein DD-endopeptidase MepM and murein hydrolase activator NlpD, contain LysM domain [Acetitomaculum ruminis DSM 5522]